MTRDQVAAILAYRAKAWSYTNPDADEARVWMNSLAEEPDVCASEAIQHLAKSDEKPPSIARFREVRRSLARANQPALPPAGVADRMPLDVFKAGLATARAALRKEVSAQ